MKKLLLPIAFLFAPMSLWAAPEVRPGYGAAEGLKEKFAAQRAAARVPARSQPQTQVEVGEELSAAGRLEQLVDAGLLLSVAVSKEEAEVLVTQGFVRVESPEALAGRTLFGDRAFHLLRVGPSRDECLACDPALLGPSEGELKIHLGQEVKLRLRRDRQGLLMVVGIARGA